MKEAKQFLKQYLNFNETVVVAVSGGPDSMALLHLLIEYRKIKKINIICAHVNHKIRKESDDEAIFVEEYCKKNNVIFEKYCITKYNHDNFHNDARKKRYKFFEDLIYKYQASYLFTAHHGDDLIESILMRIVRGSSLRGYSGISSVQNRDTYSILRPLLYETKDSIMLYISKNKLNYVTDNSNFKDIYTRNRYRKGILPILKCENENVHKKFKKFSDNILEIEEYIEKKVINSFEKVFENNILNLELYFEEDKFIRKRIVMKILENLYKENLYMINDSHVDNINKLILGSNGKKINLPFNKIFFKNDNKIYIEEENNNKSYKIKLETITNLPNGKIIEKIDNTEINNNYICRLSSNDIEFPLFLRTRKGGDKMYVKNMSGRKKINDIFTDYKIPETKRDSWPILVDNKDEILWVPGLKKSKYDIEKNINCDIILKYR